MKLRQLFTVAALVGTLALSATAAPALAADSVIAPNPRGEGTEFLVATELLNAGWHLPLGEANTVKLKYRAEGLALTAGSTLIYPYDPVDPAASSAFRNGMALAENFSADLDVPSDTVFGQVYVILDGAAISNRFSKDLSSSSDNRWVSAENVGSFVSGASYSYDELMSSIGEHRVIAYGIAAGPADTVVRSFTFAGFSTTFAQGSDEMPYFSPAIPAASAEDLDPALRDDSLVLSQPTPKTAVLRGAAADENPAYSWVYVFGYSSPQRLGWVKSINGQAQVDLSRLGEGEHTIAVMTQHDDLAWTAAVVGPDDSGQPEPGGPKGPDGSTGQPPVTQTPATQPPEHLSQTGVGSPHAALGNALGAAALLAVGALALFLGRRQAGNN